MWSMSGRRLTDRQQTGWRPIEFRQRRRAHEDRGQGTVELALVLPVIVVAMLAVVQIGLIGRDQVIVWHAAREAARAAAVNLDSAAVRSAAVGSGSALDETRLVVTLSGGSSSGQLTTATIGYRSPTDVPVVGHLIGDINMTAEVTMRIE